MGSTKQGSHAAVHSPAVLYVWIKLVSTLPSPSKASVVQAWMGSTKQGSHAARHSPDVA